jgi:hypothetical protein
MNHDRAMRQAESLKRRADSERETAALIELARQRSRPGRLHTLDEVMFREVQSGEVNRKRLSDTVKPTYSREVGIV